MIDSVKLRTARLAAGLTQEKLAKLSGITKVTISGIENRRRENVTLNTLSRLAKQCNVKAADLLK